MLDPYRRHHLFAILRPPDGYRLDRAIGTTFSLDLVTLLTLPLAFTFFTESGDRETLLRDPLALLDGVRRYARRMLIFCQAGQIAVPQESQPLFAYLEESVFEVAPPHHVDGVFHPKVWLLRYLPESNVGENEPVRYRFVCLSRNLTFDRSWDTVLTLDGVLTDRTYAYSRNHPLGDFFAALPGMLVRPGSLPSTAADVVDRLQDEVRRVDFRLPDGFQELAFIPIGLTRRHSWPFWQSVTRQLVVSPFITPGFLQRFGSQSDDNRLVSRVDSLMQLTAPQLALYHTIYVLNDEATPEETDDETAVVEESATLATESEDDLEQPLSGLHAKLFIAEYSWDATVWTGSANATNAAFRRNVEFLVQLTGRKSRIGIDKFLSRADTGSVGFLDLLMPYKPAADAVDPDPEAQELEAAATAVRRRLARLPLQAVVTPLGNEEEEEQYQVSVQYIERQASPLSLPQNTTVICRPISLQLPAARPVQPEEVEIASFDRVSFVGLTPFFAFSVTVTAGRRAYTSRFVLAIPLQNAPEDRRERVLRHLLDSRDKILRYLLFLLAESDEGVATLAELLQQRPGQDTTAKLFQLSGTLFEALVKSLHQQPDRLAHIHQLVTDLKKAGNEHLLPDGFDTIWEPIWQAYERLYPPQTEAEHTP